MTYISSVSTYPLNLGEQLFAMRTNSSLTDTQSDSRKILLAEDEPMIRSLIQQFLHSWGYQVFSASNGREAMDFAEEHEAEIDLLVSDVIMPEMDGLELAEKLKAKRPKLPVILLSGYSHTQFALQREWKFIQKPFKSHELKAAVEDSLKPKSDLRFLDQSENSSWSPVTEPAFSVDRNINFISPLFSTI